MDVKTLREIRDREQKNPSLQNVGKDFYNQLRDYLQEIYPQYAECRKSGEISRLGEFKNIENIINDIFETRERKIVLSALYYVRSENEIEFENLTTEEEEIVRGIVEILKENRSHIPSFEKLSEKVQEDKKTKMPTLTVRILKDLPPIVGTDGKIYGAFKQEDVVTLPEPNAKVFINQGVAELINFE